MLLVKGPLVCAQEVDSLYCQDRKQEILKSSELDEWRKATINYQKSTIIWLSYRKENIQAHNDLDDYDYEWKTKRWRDVQNRLKKNAISTDSLRDILAIKVKALEDKFSQLHLLPCKQSFFEEMYKPVKDSLKVFRDNIYENRY